MHLQSMCASPGNMHDEVQFLCLQVLRWLCTVAIISCFAKLPALLCGVLTLSQRFKCGMSYLQVLLLAAEALHLNHRSGVNSTGDFSKVEYVLDTEMQARVAGAVHPA